MIGDPQSIKAFKTSITPENVKFFWDSDSDRICSDPYHFAFIRIRNFAQVFSCQFSCSYRRGNTSENLSSRHFVSLHLHHNLCRIAFLSESFNVSVGNCNLLSGRVLCSERGLQTDRVICAEEGSELDDVANKVCSCFNPRRSRRRSCFVGEFEKKLCEESFGMFTQTFF